MLAITTAQLVCSIIIGFGVLLIGFVVKIIADNGYDSPIKKPKRYLWIWIIISIAMVALQLFGYNWWNTSRASGIRNYKDWQSEVDNGIEREILITAEDGREIFYYEGKVDIESNHEDNYIKFEGEDGKRYIIYYGITDSILIIEK